LVCSEDLDLLIILAEEWDHYRALLAELGISLVNKLDELIWIGGDFSGVISVKNIYEALSNILWKKNKEDGGNNYGIGNAQ